MPPAFHASRVDLGFEDFFVVADQNQQISELNSSRQEIETFLDLDTDAVIELRRNFRNRYRVAKYGVRSGSPRSRTATASAATSGAHRKTGSLSISSLWIGSSARRSPSSQSAWP